jgi:hypothetical protein
MKLFNLEDIVSVYLGVPGKCMCGCSGNYAYTSTNVKYAGKDRGYSIDDDEISDRKVKARLKRFYADPTEPEKLYGYIFTKTINEKQITIYLKDKRS